MSGLKRPHLPYSAKGQLSLASGCLGHRFPNGPRSSSAVVSDSVQTLDTVLAPDICFPIVLDDFTFRFPMPKYFVEVSSTWWWPNLAKGIMYAPQR